MLSNKGIHWLYTETREEAAFPLKCAPSYASSLQIGASYCLL